MVCSPERALCCVLAFPANESWSISHGAVSGAEKSRLSPERWPKQRLWDKPPVSAVGWQVTGAPPGRTPRAKVASPPSRMVLRPTSRGNGLAAPAQNLGVGHAARRSGCERRNPSVNLSAQPGAALRIFLRRWFNLSADSRSAAGRMQQPPRRRADRYTLAKTIVHGLLVFMTLPVGFSNPFA